MRVLCRKGLLRDVCSSGTTHAIVAQLLRDEETATSPWPVGEWGWKRGAEHQGELTGGTLAAQPDGRGAHGYTFARGSLRDAVRVRRLVTSAGYNRLPKG